MAELNPYQSPPPLKDARRRRRLRHFLWIPVFAIGWPILFISLARLGGEERWTVLYSRTVLLIYVTWGATIGLILATMDFVRDRPRN